MTVRCPSNGRSASSTSGLLAPAAQSSAGRAACSCLPCPAVLPPLAMPSLYAHQHLLLFSGDGSLTSQPKQSTHVLPSAWETTANSSLPLCRPLPRPRRRPPPWCSRCGLVNVVNDRHASEVDCTWRGRQLGPRPHARKCLLITRKLMIPPPDIWDQPKGPLYFAKKRYRR